MISARPNVGVDVEQGYRVIERDPDVTPANIRSMGAEEPSWVEQGQDLRHALIEALAEYVASTNNAILKKEGRKRALEMAVLVKQLVEVDGLDDLQLAARLVRYMKVEDNRDKTPRGPFGSSKDMREAVMAKVCEFLEITNQELEIVMEMHRKTEIIYMTNAASYGGGAGLAAALSDPKTLRQKSALELADKRMQDKTEDRGRSLFVQDLFKTINEYQQSTRYKGCCMFGRVKLWKQQGFDRADKLKGLISDMVTIENLSDDQIRSELREYANFKKHIGLFDSSKQLRGMMLEVLTNQPRQEDRQQLDL